MYIGIWRRLVVDPATVRQQLVVSPEPLLADSAHVLPGPAVDKLDVFGEDASLLVHLAAEVAGVLVALLVGVAVFEHGVLAVEVPAADVAVMGAIRVQSAVPRQRGGHLERPAAVVTLVQLLGAVGVGVAGELAL